MIPFSWKNIEPAYQALLERELRAAADLERLLLDRSEIDAHVDEVESRAYDRTNVATRDKKAKRAFLVFVEEVRPKWEAVSFALDKKIVESKAAAELDPEVYGVLLRQLRAAVEGFREDNVALSAHESVRAAEYTECVGKQSVVVDGEPLTQQAAAALLVEPERELRERAWTASSAVRLADAERIDGIFGDLVETRTRMARNAGFDDYRGLAFLKMRRFDYSPEDCEAFHAGVEEHFVPLQAQLLEQRREGLGVETLAPWDLRVDTLGAAALRPFETVEELIEKTSRIVHRVDAELGELFDRLRDGESLDLESRPGKAPGGYQNTYPQTKRCFILMNAVGLPVDVDTLLHEGGHALHTMLASDQALLAYRDAGGEFSEVASMTMELFGAQHLDVFYGAEDAARARRMHLERIVAQFPWTARIDAFQHWVYANPECGPDERAEAWLALGRRFQPDVDWSGHRDAEARDWHRVPHFFTHPFYFIEYGIAQLGALGLWQRHGTDPGGALESYKNALRLGGSRPLPQLFEAAGLEFDLGAARLEAAAGVLRNALEL